MRKRKLIFEDGTVFTGQAFGSMAASSGEVVFFTGMTGYQEMLTDPNYNGQIAVMTYPLIGNYGINRDDFETITPFVRGVVAKEITDIPSNFRSEETFAAFLERENIPGITGIDTRMVTRLLRKKGTMRAIITEVGKDEYSDRELEEMFTALAEENLVAQSSITRPYIIPGRGKRITVVDLGMKQSILHELTERDCNVTVVPYDVTVEDILRFKPDGVLFSNGPGNPLHLPTVVQTINQLLGKIPIFGIGLGHQLFALACGAEIGKLYVGNYGTSYVVKDVVSDLCYSTTQSRHYYVKEDSLPQTDLQVRFRALNDGQVEGLVHQKYPAFSVQFNPEGAPGPNDTNYLFDQFLELIERFHATDGGI